MKSLSSLIVAATLIASSASSFAAYQQLPVTTADTEVAQERTLTEGGSDRTSIGQRVAEGGSDRTSIGQRVAEGGSDRLAERVRNA